jgi:hypothetical protein
MNQARSSREFKLEACAGRLVEKQGNQGSNTQLVADSERDARRHHLELERPSRVECAARTLDRSNFGFIVCRIGVAVRARKDYRSDSLGNASYRCQK